MKEENGNQYAETISDLLEWVKTFDSCKKYLFRGQTNNHPPCPRIFRDNTRRSLDGGNKPYDQNYDLEGEKRILELFIKRALPHLTYKPEFQIDWMAIAQHHEMPTRLLDWTGNVLAAAYFSCEDMGAGDTERQAIIYALPAPTEVTEEIKKDPFISPENTINLYIPPVVSPRIAAQNSYFTIQDKKYNFASVKKIFINKTSEKNIKSELARIAIDRYALFPDIDGLAKSLYWKYKWQQPLF